MRKPQLAKRDIECILGSDVQVQDSIDTGAFKQVFPVEIGGKKYVIKVLSLSSVNEKRVVREIDLLRACDCPFLVRLGPLPCQKINYGGDDLIYYSEELIEGTALSDMIVRDLLAVQQLVGLANNMSYAIEEIWKCGSIHRDIKPDNIIFDSARGAFVLLDLGIAFDLAGDALTTDGKCLGTPGYLSPEQLDIRRKYDLDFRSDFFTLGIVLYEAATGSLPFPVIRSSIQDAARGILDTAVVPPIEIRANLPQSLSDIIMRLLGKERHERYHSFEQFRIALDHVM